MELTYQQNNDTFVHLFSCCIPVKGYQRSAIYDIQREDIELVPNTMIEFLNYIHGKKRSEILKEFESDKTAKDYLAFLEKKEFIFYSPNSYFPDIPPKSINEDTSSIYFTTIILSQFIRDNIDTAIKNINELGVKRLHFHIDNEDSMAIIKNILELLEYSRITNLSFSIPFQKIDKKIYQDNRLKTIYIFNSPKKRIIQNKEVSNVFITSDGLSLFLPKFGLNTIDINIGTYNIAKNYNLSLYKTIFIDKEGVIKFNSLDKENYGNITDSLNDLKTKTIKKLSKIWNIRKTEISPCNICEFRFCCTVTYIPKRKNKSYELECNYNPYTNDLN
ncbi:hypothetical protein [Chryseobacterium oranimense]|uniref:hypothetical protein n=1 Tax=Chryseobacterium oranimense TaxID=421058 RepID=UPI0005339F91|nr:hypothetical protein [Chryseobacterium oranimense]CEJ68527.1 hypothetical protein BN1195_00815 [Chryseobacterium oranimense G311]